MGKIAVYHCLRRRREYKDWNEITSVACPKAGRRSSAAALACGKTLFSIEFLVHGATRFNERAFYCLRGD